MKKENVAAKIAMEFCRPQKLGGGPSQKDPLAPEEKLRQTLSSMQEEGSLRLAAMLAFVGISGSCERQATAPASLSDEWSAKATWWKTSFRTPHGRGSLKMGMGSAIAWAPTLHDAVSGFLQSKGVMEEAGTVEDVIAVGFARNYAQAREFLKEEKRSANLFDRLMGPLANTQDEEELATAIADMAMEDPRLLDRSGARIIGALDAAAVCGSVAQVARLAGSIASLDHIRQAALLIEDGPCAAALRALGEARELGAEVKPGEPRIHNAARL